MIFSPMSLLSKLVPSITKKTNIHKKPRSMYQYPNMAPSFRVKIVNFVKFLLSPNSQKRLGYTENSTKYRSLNRKPRSHVRILIYRMSPIVPHGFTPNSCFLYDGCDHYNRCQQSSALVTIISKPLFTNTLIATTIVEMNLTSFYDGSDDKETNFKLARTTEILNLIQKHSHALEEDS